jgi:hypothetical protein
MHPRIGLRRERRRGSRRGEGVSLIRVMESEMGLH